MLNKFKSKKGFTLMEMLIVVAIIAVLIAIAIPTFTSSLNKAKAGVDLANIRSGYANAQIFAMTEGTDAAATYYLNEDGTVTKDSPGTYKTQSKSADVGSNSKVGGKFEVNKAGTDGVQWEANKNIQYTISGGEVTEIKVVS